MAKLFGVEMHGKTVLDVGGYDGSRGARCLKAGARRVAVVDNGEHRTYGWSEPAERPQGVVFYEGDLLEADFIERFQGWEILLCFNMLYHLRDPFDGLRRLRATCGEALVLRTSFVSDHEAGADRWCWYEQGSGHKNGTVWARPSLPGLIDALLDAGFTASLLYYPGSTGDPDDYQANDEVTYICRPVDRN